MQIIYASGCLLVRKTAIHFCGQRLSTFAPNGCPLLWEAAVYFCPQRLPFGVNLPRLIVVAFNVSPMNSRHKYLLAKLTLFILLNVNLQPFRMSAKLLGVGTFNGGHANFVGAWA